MTDLRAAKVDSVADFIGDSSFLPVTRKADEIYHDDRPLRFGAPIPDSVTDDDALWSALAKIAFRMKDKPFFDRAIETLRNRGSAGASPSQT